MDEKLFDYNRGIVRNTNGKVNESNGLYVSGWLKRGPSGIIGTNIVDAKDTVASILRDLESENIVIKTEDKEHSNNNFGRGRQGLDKLLLDKQIQSVNWQQYEIIDTEEKNPLRKRTEAQPREKITSCSKMIEVINNDNV